METGQVTTRRRGTSQDTVLDGLTYEHIQGKQVSAGRGPMCLRRSDRTGTAPACLSGRRQPDSPEMWGLLSATSATGGERVLWPPLGGCGRETCPSLSRGPLPPAPPLYSATCLLISFRFPQALPVPYTAGEEGQCSPSNEC